MAVRSGAFFKRAGPPVSDSEDEEDGEKDEDEKEYEDMKIRLQKLEEKKEIKLDGLFISTLEDYQRRKVEKYVPLLNSVKGSELEKVKRLISLEARALEALARVPIGKQHFDPFGFLHGDYLIKVLERSIRAPVSCPDGVVFVAKVITKVNDRV